MKHFFVKFVATTGLILGLGGCLGIGEPAACADKAVSEQTLTILYQSYQEAIPEKSGLKLKDLVTFDLENQRVVAYDDTIKVRKCELQLAVTANPNMVVQTRKFMANVIAAADNPLLSWALGSDMKPVLNWVVSRKGDPNLPEVLRVDLTYDVQANEQRGGVMVTLLPKVDLKPYIQVLTWGALTYHDANVKDIEKRNADAKQAAMDAKFPKVEVPVNIKDTEQAMQPGIWRIYPESTLVCGPESLCIRTHQGSFYRTNVYALSAQDNVNLDTHIKVGGSVCIKAVQEQGVDGMRLFDSMLPNGC